jgi:2-polyprenyl-3-methyl-5-hydroxy-6-metoxy-1,4-benzoquinol methylase
MNDLVKAVHFPGGNHFENLRLDIPASFERQDQWLSQISKQAVSRARTAAFWDRMLFLGLRRLNLWEAAVTTGVIRSWLCTFSDYWQNCLQGRPIRPADFQGLYFLYRCKFQSLSARDWHSAEKHVANWQAPENLFLSFQLAYRTALDPIRSHDFLSLMQPGMRILEYGCATGPMYATWRRFASHVPCQWLLADIPGFPFHYARHIYGRDESASFLTITPDRFNNPLQGLGPFDMIILQEVLEHLDHPLHVIRLLVDALRPGGLLFMDYVKSEALHLDSEGGLRERMDVLRYLNDKFDWIKGQFKVEDRSLPQVVGRKRA